MADWAGVQTALKTWFESASGLSADWRDQQRPVRFKARSFLKIINSSRIGGTELNYEFDGAQPAGQEMVPVITGTIQFTLQCTVVSRSHNPSDDARYYLELARTRLRVPSLQQALQDAGLAIVRSLGVTDLNFTFDNRAESRATMDVIFTLGECERVTDEGLTNIEKVELSSDIDDQAGNDIGNDFDEEIFGDNS